MANMESDTKMHDVKITLINTESGIETYMEGGIDIDMDGGTDINDGSDMKNCTDGEGVFCHSPFQNCNFHFRDALEQTCVK